MRTLIILVLVLALCGTAVAKDSSLSVGAGAYAVVFDYDVEGVDATQYQGYAVTGTMALGPSSAVRGDLYFTKHEEHDELSLNGFDAQFLLGSNLTGAGFKVYLLGGYWSESFERDDSVKSDSSNDFSGWMAGVGLGINWESASLDAWAALRQTDPYTDEDAKSADESDLRVGCASVALTLRF